MSRLRLRLFACSLACIAMMLANLGCRNGTSSNEQVQPGPAVIFKSSYKGPNESGGSSSRFMIADVVAVATTPEEKCGENNKPFGKVEVKYAMVDNKLIKVDTKQDASIEGHLKYGICFAPKDACETGELTYDVFRDDKGFYLADPEDPKKVRHRFASKEPGMMLFDANQFICRKLFPTDVQQLAE